MSPTRYDTMEMIRQKVTMSQEIAKKDPEYGWYAGAEPRQASLMAKIDTCLDYGVFPESELPMIKFYRAWLGQQAKAFFASMCGELSKLGFIRGYTRTIKSATGTRAYLNRARETSVQKTDQ